MSVSWSALPEALQLHLSEEALRRASAIIAEQAEELAQEMESGNVGDRGGADALRLFARVVRLNGRAVFSTVGHA